MQVILQQRLTSLVWQLPDFVLPLMATNPPNGQNENADSGKPLATEPPQSTAHFTDLNSTLFTFLGKPIQSTFLEDGRPLECSLQGLLINPAIFCEKETEVNWDLYLRLSALMFMEFAIWGAWMPVLAVRLLGPLKMTGKQTGWIYATFPLASIFAPLVSGYLADKWFHAEHILLAAHALGAVLLFLAAKQTRFRGMFLTMFLYSICYTATIPLVVKMLFSQLPAEATGVFFWAPVSWALVGYFLTGMRQLRKIGGDGPDCLYLAALLSLLMVLVCLLQHPAEPKAEATTNPLTAALGMLSNSNYLVFMLVQLFVSGMQQFYFLGTGQFMQDRGIKGKNISAAMGIAQAVQAAATILLLGWLIKNWGYQGTFVVGSLCWSVLFLTYVVTKGKLAGHSHPGISRLWLMSSSSSAGKISWEIPRRGNFGLGSIAVGHRHHRHRIVRRHATGGHGHGKDFRRRQVPMDEDLGGSLGNHPGGSDRLRRVFPRAR